MQINQTYFLDHGLAIDVIPSYLKNSSTYFAVMTDMNGNYIYANDYFVDVFSELFSNFIGVNALETIHFDDHEICINTMQQLFQSPQSTIQVILRKSLTKEEYYYTSWEFSIVYNKINQAVGIYCIGHNVSERIKGSLQSVKIENTLSYIVNSSSDGIVLISQDYKVLDFNNTIRQMYLQYLNREIHIGDSIWDFAVAGSEESFKQHFALALEGEIIELDKELVLPDNKSIWFSFKYYPAFDDIDKLIGVVFSVINIDKRKNLELAIKKNEKRNRLALSILNYGICEFDLQKDEVILDKEYKKIIELDTNILRERIEDWSNRIYPLDKVEVLAAFQKYIDGKSSSYQIDYRQFTEKGNLRWIRSRAEILEYGSNGKAIRVLGLITDITNEKLKQDEIIKLSKAVEFSPAISVITDRDGIIEYVNPKFSDITGYQSNEAIGKNPNILKSGHQDTSFYQEMWDLLNNGKIWKGEFLNKKKNGEVFWVSSAIAPILNSNNEITHYIALSEDITTRKNLEENLNIALNKALESEKLKNAFLFNLSHEIRTPLNGILGFMDILQSFDLSELEREEFGFLLKKSGTRLLNMIDDLVSISKIQTGQIYVNLSKFNISTLIYDISEKYLPYIDSKKLQIIHHIDPNHNEFELESDKEIITQILLHLFANSMKFTNEGFIEIGFQVEDASVLFFVKDSGIGINQENVHLIFEKFRQIEEHLNRSYEGIGLGLSICKGFVDILKGKIWLESEENKGTTVYFTIPI